MSDDMNGAGGAPEFQDLSFVLKPGESFVSAQFVTLSVMAAPAGRAAPRGPAGPRLLPVMGIQVTTSLVPGEHRLRFIQLTGPRAPELRFDFVEAGSKRGQILIRQAELEAAAAAVRARNGGAE